MGLFPQKGKHGTMTPLVVCASAASFPNVVSGEASGGANCHNRLCSHQSLCSVLECPVLECSISYAHVLIYIGSLEPSLRISSVDILESRDPERFHSIEYWGLHFEYQYGGLTFAYDQGRGAWPPSRPLNIRFFDVLRCTKKWRTSDNHLPDSLKPPSGVNWHNWLCSPQCAFVSCSCVWLLKLMLQSVERVTTTCR